MEVTGDLRSQFASASEKKQLQLISQFASDRESLRVLMEFLQSYRSQSANPVIGKIYQTLYQSQNNETQSFLQNYFPRGVVPLRSERNIDYLPIQVALARQDFQTADLLSLQKLCELAGEAATQRKWLYFTEVAQFPALDLQTIDRLWFVYSEGKFGYSVQRRLWLSLGRDLSKLWLKIGWKKENNWTRYPEEFIWNLTAPLGHLPTSNQLRGAKVITSLFSHPVWAQK